MANQEGQLYQLKKQKPISGSKEALGKESTISQMYKNIRSWMWMLLLIGVLQIFASSTMDPGWGLLLLVLAFLSWRVKIPAMFVIYSILLGWAALTNFLSVTTGGQNWWLLLAGFQVVWVVSNVKEYKRYRSLKLQELYQSGHWPGKLPPPQDEAIISEHFAIASLILAAAALILVPCSFIGYIVYLASMGEEAILMPTQQMDQVMNAVNMGYSILVDFTVLALGLGCAALLSKTRFRGIALAGVIMSSIVLLIHLVFLLLPTA